VRLTDLSNMRSLLSSTGSQELAAGDQQ
jgi:hypothetical protein